MSTELCLDLVANRVIRRRNRIDSKPHYKRNRANQLDAVSGSPELMVPTGHLARQVWEIVSNFDFSSVDKKRSSLGRHGHDPRRIIAVLVYGSLAGVHHASKISAAIETDHAFRLLSGGHKIPEGTLRRLRGELREFFASALEQSVRLAHQEGLLRLDEIAGDSVKIRAHAARSNTRTLSRSRTRLAELAKVVIEELSVEARQKHDATVKKHTDAVERCEAESRTSLATTNPLAGLIKFPDGGSAPGHRVTVAASGATSRIVVALLVDSTSQDHGHVGPLLDALRETLQRIGIVDPKIEGLLDAGYWGEEDIAAAEARSDWADVVIAEGGRGERAYFQRDRFTFCDDGTVLCPANRLMHGPTKLNDGFKYQGIGCETCTLKPQCTTAKRRTLTVFPLLERARAKLNSPTGKARYRKRIAIVEPVFSNVESNMGYRRSATRTPAAIIAEIYLKAAAHNISRVLARRKVFCVLVVLN